MKSSDQKHASEYEFCQKHNRPIEYSMWNYQIMNNIGRYSDEFDNHY